MSGSDLGPLYISVERFGPWLGEQWDQYLRRSGLTQLKEVVSLDPGLCSPVLQEVRDEYWPHIVNEDFMLDYFTDLKFHLAQVADVEGKNTLCVYRNPQSQPIAPAEILQFEFLGYDLVDVFGSGSALTHRGGFTSAYSKSEINAFGLLDTLERAIEVQASLRANYPNEDHAECHCWAIFRATGS